VIAVGVGIVVVALVVAGLVFGLGGLFSKPEVPQAPVTTELPSEATEIPAAPTGVPSVDPSGVRSTWSMMQLTLSNDASVTDSGTDNIAVISIPMDDGSGTCMLTAVNAETLSVPWIATSGCGLYPSTEGLVTTQDNPDGTVHVQVIDATSGSVTADTDLTAGDTVVAVGGGIVYIQDVSATSDADTGCARDMTLGPCLWQGPGIATGNTDSPVAVFGDYTWINTVDGIRDFHTGAPAPFGSGCSQADGPTADHVLCEMRSGGPMTYQQVDTTTGQAIGPVITPIGLMSFSEDSSVYVFLQDESGNQSHLVGYSWDTGQQVFDTSVNVLLNPPSHLLPKLAAGQVGSAMWAYHTELSSVESLAAFSLSTGTIMWDGANAGMVGVISVNGTSTVYVSDGLQVTGLDADTVQPVLTTDLPAGLTATIAGDHVVAMDNSMGIVWVLKS